MEYVIYKTVHLLGVVILLGNVTVTAVWKAFADRTRRSATVAFAQEMVTVTDWAFTLSGVVLTIVGGYGMAWVAGLDLLGLGWLLWSQVLFYGAGLIWVFVLIPTQIALARQARELARGGPIPASFRRRSWRWHVWGIVATLPLLAVFYLMVAKI